MSDAYSISDALTLRDPSGGASAALGRIDQYELIRELGGGGFGTVYLARNTVSGIEVAVKGLPPLVRHNREELANIRTNFALVSRLHHPNIAAALDLHPAARVDYTDQRAKESLRVFPGDTMMVMQYAPGISLSEWRKQYPNGRVPLDRALAIIRQVASALDYAHAQRIIHRDVKPSNVMIETRDNGSIIARVLDFGLAAEIQSSMGRISQEVRDKSGTRPYMAPEQWKGLPQGPGTDLYALAVMFYELVTGDVPFASVFSCGDPVIMMTTVTGQTFEPDHVLPRHMRTAMVRAMSKKLDDRFRSCGAFVKALSGGGASFGRPLGLVCGVVALALVVAGAWVWTQNRKAEAERRDAEDQRREDQRRKTQEDAENAAKKAAERAKQADERAKALREAAARKRSEEAEAKAKAAEREAKRLAERAAEEQKRRQQDEIKRKDQEAAERKNRVIAKERKDATPISMAEFAALKPEKFASGTARRVKMPGDVSVEMIWCAPRAIDSGCPTNGFWLGKFEVSQALWTSVMKENPSRFPAGTPERYPVESVSREDCLLFIDKLNGLSGTKGFRLPTETEWEYACRAGSTTAFFWGTEGASDKMCVGETKGGPSVFGKYPANKWGFCDMHGNVAEWCDSRFACSGEDAEDAYVLRGGSWNSSASEASSSARMKCLTYNGSSTCGLRLCFSATRVPSKTGEAKNSLPSVVKSPVVKSAAKPTKSSASASGVKTMALVPGALKRITIAAGVDLEFLWCPPGAFLMGSPMTEEERILGVEDRHEVELTEGFWMSKYEVTKQLWQEVMKDNSVGILDNERDPKSEVSWYDCTNFIVRLNRRLRGACVRLPTEAEWEYACRAGTTTVFSFGNSLNGDQACCDGDDPYGTDARGETWKMGPTKIGNYSRYTNKWGINDMHGNLFEWCADWYALYPRTKQTNPQGPAAGDRKIARGGSWRSAARQCRSAFRMCYEPGMRNNAVGFRICLSASPEETLQAAKGKASARPVFARPVRSDELKPGTRSRITIAADVDLELAWCPPGSFLMGSPMTEEERILDVEDQHEVVLTKGFWLSKYEVTKRVWQKVMEDGSFGMLDNEREPKSEISWHDCMNFIDKINRRLKGARVRLPTEAEWEYACRAGTTTVFSFGNVLNGDQACCNGNDPYGTLERGETWKMGPAKIGSYSKFANKWGFNDMHGNLFEWCADWYEAYARKKQMDPTGPSVGEWKVARGGCWLYAARQCRSAFRMRFDPETRNAMIGLRLCCDQTE